MSKRAKRETETPEYAAMCRRLIMRLGDRVAEGDPYDLHEFARLQKELDAALDHAVAGLRQVDERTKKPRFSWSEVGGPLGITRQAAQQRFR